MRNTTWLIYECPGDHARIGVAIPNSDPDLLSWAYDMLCAVLISGIPDRAGGWWYCEAPR